MTPYEQKIFNELTFGKITVEEFYKKFPIDIGNDIEYVRNQVSLAIASGDQETLDDAIYLIMLTHKTESFTDILNNLLINPNHTSHQMITKTLQSIKSPSSVPFIRKVLKSNFDYLEYTCSESGTIAKWFSWALYEIGTEEAIELMKEFSNSTDEEISSEMKYRLNKLNSR